MCGIAGQIALKKNAFLNPNEVKKMLKIIIHRGPDGEGCYISDNYMFGMRRLSIIDLDGGWQPIKNEDETIVCCSNGEIYNYIELKQELEKKGHIFKTNSDTEVIVHAYEEWGEMFVKRLNGMFAIAILDNKNNSFYLYRDRLGKKPLYFSEQYGKLYFASEIKSILCCENIERKCNLKALDFLLTYNYIPNDMTSFEGIKKLMPGKYCIVKNGKITEKTYWQLKINDTFESNITDISEIKNKISELITDAVSIRLRSDVEVGAFLSGGVDSSLVCAYASKYRPELKTFSIGFEEEQFDESKYSKQVASYLGINLINKVVDSNFFELLPTTIWLNDDPHGDVSFLPLYVLSSMTSKYVKTVLTGDGGDELFGGYDKYLEFASDTNRDVIQFFEQNSVFSKEEKRKLYSDDLFNAVENEDCLEYVKNVLENNHIDYKACDKLNVLLFLETKLLLEGNNLVKPDRMGMGSSIEARMPLLDYRLVEYVFSLPSTIKINENEAKILLKQVAEEYLPKDIVYRKKQMFTVPIGEWFKGPLKDITYEILMSEKFANRNLFNIGYVKKMLDEHMAGIGNYTRQLRLLVVIELWHRIFIDEMHLNAPSMKEII